ncbi:MAG: hypothetical protein DSY90_14565 [Deltaproteobacteria bacterium]|nr:MAG: hypothetical protein DSY90_14565 [Deltaproteobacteria bacterium]
MGNHFHLLVKMLPESDFSDCEILKRCRRMYGDDYDIPDEPLPLIRKKLASLSELMRDIKVNFTRYYNRRHHRRGYFWGERFKSVIVDRGETLVNCLAYIDLNPLRAGLVKRPEEYRWSSIGYHIQTDNRDNFLSTDFGLKEFNVSGEKERIRRYRRYMYEAGCVDRPDKGKSRVIDPRILYKEKKKGPAGCATGPGILPIRGLSDPENSYRAITSDSSICSCPRMRKSPNRLTGFPGSIPSNNSQK